jgi:hypothetical protein
MKPSRAFIGILVLLVLSAAACKQQQPVLANSAVRSPSSPNSGAAPIVAASNPAAPENQHATPQKPNAANVPQLEDIESHEGPFKIGDRDYTVSMRFKRISGTGSKTLSSLEILDTSKQVYFQQSFTHAIENGDFTDSCSASTDVFHGNMVNFLWVSFPCDTDDSSEGGPWQLFGPLNGKLVAFGKPIATQGDFIRFVPGAVTKNGAATMFQADTLEFKVSAGNVFVTIPLRVNLSQGSLDLGIHCLRQTGHGMAESGCDVPVQVERSRIPDEMTFVRMFGEPAESSGTPAHVVIRKDSNVEFLAANVKPTFTLNDNFMVLAVGGDLWLKVRIDGKEGWIHTQEDFDAIGLPLAG